MCFMPILYSQMWGKKWDCQMISYYTFHFQGSSEWLLKWIEKQKISIWSSSKPKIWLGKQEHFQQQPQLPSTSQMSMTIHLNFNSVSIGYLQYLSPEQIQIYCISIKFTDGSSQNRSVLSLQHSDLKKLNRTKKGSHKNTQIQSGKQNLPLQKASGLLFLSLGFEDK